MKTIKILSTSVFTAFLFISIQTISARTFDDSTYLGSNTARATIATSKYVTVKLGAVKDQEGLNFQILDNNQHILVAETVKSAEIFRKKYDMSRLEDGQYEMVVEGKLNRTTQPFTVKGGTVKMSEKDKVVKQFPTFKFKNNQLDVHVLLNDYGNVVVRLLDNENRALYNDTHRNQFQFSKRYDLSKLSSGDYRVEVTAADEKFYYDVTK